MNAGKSTVLLQAAHNYAERGMQTYLMTAKLDNRVGEVRIASRIGIDARADTFEDGEDLFAKIKARLDAGPCSCVLLTRPNSLKQSKSGNWPEPSTI